MCGIIAAHDPRRGLTESLLARMAGVIRHRGPDDTGLWTDGLVGVGNQRLSIIDLAGGHQPFVSDDGNVVVVQNGEIYNYRELAAELAGTPFACRSGSDTEVLLRLYEREGTAFLPKLNGMFAIAIADRRDGSLFLARDRIGVKPLYWARQGAGIVAGSEIKSLIAAGLVPKPDFEGLHHYLTFNYVPPPYTAFAGIRHVMPGTWMRVDRGGHITEGAWYTLPVAPEDHVTGIPAWCDRFNEIFSSAVDIRMRADVPFGAFLSGGVDSSAVVGVMAKRLGRPVQTFTIGFDDPRFDESPYAREAAERFGTRHTCEIMSADLIDLWPRTIWHNDQPHGDASMMPTWMVSQVAARQVKMVLTGDGGDELFCGYDKQRDFFTPEVAALDEATFRRRYHESISLFRTADKSALYAHPSFAGLNDSYHLVEGHFQRASRLDRINQVLHLDTALLLPGNNLVKPDRMGMAMSIEARNPFLDVRMVELAFAMPGALKLRDGITKWIFKRSVEELIGSHLAYRKKQMFTVPVGEWFKDRLRPLVTGVLDDPRTRARGLFQPQQVTALMDEHFTGRVNRTREIRALLALELWFRACIDQTFDHAPTFAELGISQVRSTG